MKRETVGLAQSVKARLLDHARNTRVDPNHVLTRYANERFIYRLSCTEHRERVVLKGAMLLVAWIGEGLRPTRDADVLALGDFTVAELTRLFKDACEYATVPDGAEFDAASLIMRPMADESPSGGARAIVDGWLGSVRLRVQVDVGMGDATTPAPQWTAYPSLLDLPRPWIQAYRPPTAIAEKVHAMVVRGDSNTRMKDFFDVFLLAERMAFAGDELASAIGATFERRRTPIPESLGAALSPGFADAERQKQWAGFFKRIRATSIPYEFTEVIRGVARFIDPALAGARRGEPFNARWDARGPWRAA